MAELPYAPLVSIAMPVFNGGPMLRLAVQSLLDQSLTDWELLLLDDGSIDGAVQALAGLGDPRIRIIADGLNKGLSVRLNEAIALARGRYFARMDHDDIAHPERLARQVAALEADPRLDLVACRCITLTDDQRFTGYLPFAAKHEEIAGRPWLRIPMAHPGWTGRLDWFKQHRYPVPAPYYSEDFELLLRTSRNSRFAALPEVLLAYRVRERIQWKKLFRARLAQFGLQRRYFSQHGEVGQLLLSAMTTGLRIALDTKRAIDQALGRKSRPAAVAPQDAAAWQAILARIEKEVA